MATAAINNLSLKVLTPSGYKSFSAANMIVQPARLKLTIETGVTLECSFNHPFKDKNGVFVLAKNFIPGEKIRSRDGLVAITNIEVIQEDSVLFDLLDVADGCEYYTNGVISHNCEFLSSDPLLISSLISNSWKAEEPIYKDSGFSFWERIDPKKEFLVGADVAEGLEKDYSSIEVFDSKLVQIAEFRSNKISEAALYDKIKWIINYIISAKDTSGAGRRARLMWSYENNSCGKVISSLYYKDEKFPDEGELISVGEKLGMNTNASTKKDASKDLKRLLESGSMKLKSKDLINEFKNYAQVGRSDGIYNAKPGSTDDSISATLIVTRLFKYVTSYDDDAFDRLYKSKIGSGEERDLDDDGSSDIEPMPMAIL